MSSTVNSQIVLIDPSQTGKAAAVNTALQGLDQGANASLAIQADDGSHSSPYVLPYQTGDEPASSKLALRFVLLTVAGGLAADWTAYMPSGPTKLFLVQNNTTGGHNVIVMVKGQTGVIVPPAITKLCYLNGTDVIEMPLGNTSGPQPYDVGNFINGQPTAGQIVMRWIAARTVTFPANFSSNQAKAATPAAVTRVWTINKNGVQVGTCTWGSGVGTATWASSGGTSVSYNAGDLFTFATSTPADSALADIDWVFSGTR